MQMDSKLAHLSFKISYPSIKKIALSGLSLLSFSSSNFSQNNKSLELTPFSMLPVWQRVPSAAGMLLVTQRLLLLRHQSSLHTSQERRQKQVDQNNSLKLLPVFPYTNTHSFVLDKDNKNGLDFLYVFRELENILEQLQSNMFA